MLGRNARGVLVAFVLSGLATAYGELTWTASDFIGSGLPLDGSPTSGSRPCEIHDATAVLGTNGMMNIVINTNFPQGGIGQDYDGRNWRDSYGSTAHGVVFNAGDLYVAYAPAGDPWNPERLYAITVTDRSSGNANPAPQAYKDNGVKGSIWENLVGGKIYRAQNDQLTDFATGTYEGYEAAVAFASPKDAGNDRGPGGSTINPITEAGLKAQNRDHSYPNHNTLPTFLRDFDNALGVLGDAAVSWETLSPVPQGGGKYNLCVSFDPSDLDITWGLDELCDLYFFWTMECGNDGVLLCPPVGAPPVVPEPFTSALFGTLLAGVVVFHVRRRI